MINNDTEHYKLIDPVLSFLLCLDGLHPEVCLILSFNKVIESVLRDRLLPEDPELLLLLLLQAADTVIQSNNILSIH